MTRQNARRFLLIPAFVFSLLLLSVLAQGPTAVVIVHTNDLHGQLLPRAEVGGSGQIATIVRSIKPDLLLDAGDLFTGSLISDTFQGRSVIDVMNALGYDASAVGNHEFDYGMNALRERIRQARFPLLSANLKTPVSEIEPFVVVRARGLRFGILGLTTEEVKITTHPRNATSIEVIELVRAVEQVLPRARRQSDFIILLTHILPSEEEKIARAFPDLRLIIGGHSHGELSVPHMVGQTMITRTGNQGRFVGRVDLAFRGEAPVEMKANLIPVKGYVPDPQILALLAPYEQKVAAEMQQVVGEAAADLTRSRDGEAPLPNLIAESFRAFTGTQIAFHNLGGIRVDLRQGPLTKGVLFEVLPFPNTLVTLRMTGAQIKATLAWNLIAISGLRAEFDLSKPSGQRLVTVTLADGSPLGDDALYTVTTNDFLVAGGDGFSEFANGREFQDTTVFVLDAFSDYVRKLGSVQPLMDGRVKVLP